MFWRTIVLTVTRLHDLMCRYAGQVGYIIAGMKDVKEAQIGDTLYHQHNPVESLPGFKPAKAMVFAGEQKILA